MKKTVLPLLFVFILGMLIMFILMRNIHVPNSNVTFIDVKLEQAVRDAINKPTGDILKSDVNKLTSLDAHNKDVLPNVDHNDITNLAGIENLINLTELNLGNNRITILNPLKGLTKLTKLYLSNNKIKDIEALKGLTNLTELRLEVNQITSIEPLRGLIKLTSLGLSDNEITDYTPISSYHNNLVKRDFLYTTLKDVRINGDKIEIVNSTETLNLSFSNGKLSLSDTDNKRLPFEYDKVNSKITFNDKKYKSYGLEITQSNEHVILKVDNDGFLLYFMVTTDGLRLCTSSYAITDFYSPEDWGK